jgi:BatD DUF11 like domain
MKRILLGLFLFCCGGIACAVATIQSSVSKIQPGGTFKLTLKIEGDQANAIPDLTPLQKDFNILGSESSLNYTLINGQARSSSEWNILLKPKKEGVVTIPTIQVGKDKTPPLSIEITKIAPTTSQASTPQKQQGQLKDLMLLTKVDTDKPYINQQVIYTVTLYTSRKLLDTNYQAPEAQDAILVPLGDGRNYQTTKNGRVYSVEEQQFAVFPQRSGDLTIKPPSINAFIFDMMPRWVNVQPPQPVVLHVQPIPVPFNSKDWLPAKQLSLKESYDQSTVSLVEGSTLVRTISIQAVGLPSQLLPTPKFANSNQFSVYPEIASENNTLNQQNLVGTKTVRLNYLLNKTGKITIPALTIPWFNTVSGKEETSTLPEVTINVTPAAGTAKPNETSGAITAITATPLTQQKENEPNREVVTTTSPSNLPWWIAGLFALAWLCTLALWRWQRPRQGAVVTANQEQLLKELQDVCLNNKASQARDTLMRWGRWRWPDANLLNLYDLENKVDELALKQQISQLAQALYQDGDSQHLWKGEALWQAIAAFKTGSVKNDKSEPLPPINRL